MADEALEFPYFEGDTEFAERPKSYSEYRVRQARMMEEIAAEDATRTASQLGSSPPGSETASEELPAEVADSLGLRDLSNTGPEQ